MLLCNTSATYLAVETYQLHPLQCFVHELCAARVPILCIVLSKYLLRLGTLFYILSLSRLGSISQALKASASGMLVYIFSRLGSIRLGWACLSRLASICHGLACYSISYHALAVSAEAWRAILYLITLWQYPPAWQLARLGMLVYILSRLGSIWRGLAWCVGARHAARAVRP